MPRAQKDKVEKAEQEVLIALESCRRLLNESRLERFDRNSVMQELWGHLATATDHLEWLIRKIETAE